MFEEQFAEVVKDLPSKLASKIPKLQNKVESDSDLDGDKAEPKVFAAESDMS